MRSRGLTLLELLVSMGVLAILLGIGVSGYVNYRRSLLIREATSQFVTDLAYWRSQARKTSRSYQFVIIANSGAYQVGEYDKSTSGGFKGVPITKNLPAGAIFSRVRDSTFQFFAPYGTTSAANNSIEIQALGNRKLQVNLVGLTAKVVVRAP
ncbi:GspH/FimT family pseudopilin [Calidithermus timidus]|jgi:prepilin-type N-terminal cleavage/methylation domain-containing protein|uniref:GspH/FimT family pseudopilin n=1 Tax=Calidithermus timidus TaxID=307124 RepID=UPI000594E328|nr:prepilin-type N-terminal cleavage/methylation domain-containing protein [Calidithermus timidus]